MGKSSIRGNEYQTKVNFGDCDPAGIVFYPNFYRWMDQSTHHYFTALGHPTSHLVMKEKIGMPIVEAKCQFHSPLLFDDIVTIHSTIIEMKNKVFTINHDFYKDGKKVAGGYEVRVWCDMSSENMKAVTIPNDIRNAINHTESLV
ncbi:MULTISPECIES: acyl-CoA thioesterase [Bacillaceae]|uniref:Acyl-CoA thioesterase n=1 Tax=Evansella alkalicola TaxID=745819 RepID=A0ABS6JX71_9BACI|nr:MULTISPECIES: thioesterase family protein [Bacillaceae]MBU9723188.1 acyl-CoA thioesterase [Bacillus alkalicola]